MVYTNTAPQDAQLERSIHNTTTLFCVICYKMDFHTLRIREGEERLSVRVVEVLVTGAMVRQHKYQQQGLVCERRIRHFTRLHYGHTIRRHWRRKRRRRRGCSTGHPKRQDVPQFRCTQCHNTIMSVILYFSILLHCIVQWVLQVMLPSVCSFVVVVFTVFHYMFRPTWPFCFCCSEAESFRQN
jgi:hypothetical protein